MVPTLWRSRAAMTSGTSSARRRQADIDAEPHQRADHLVTEGLRRHPEDDPVLLGPPAGLEHVTDRRRPRSLAAEAGEVVLPHEGGGSGVHRLEVERSPQVPHPVAGQGVGGGAGVDEVPVRPPRRGEAGVEPLRRLRGGQHRDLGAQHPVERPAQPFDIGDLRRLEAHHLVSGVDAGVGPARPGRLDRMPSTFSSAASSSLDGAPQGWRANPWNPDPS